jgi:hypothetical protein
VACAAAVRRGLPPVLGRGELQLWFDSTTTTTTTTSTATTASKSTLVGASADTYIVDDDGGYAEVHDVPHDSNVAVGGVDATASNVSIAELFWKVHLKALLCAKFGRRSLTRQERAPDYSFRAVLPVILWLLFQLSIDRW